MSADYLIRFVTFLLMSLVVGITLIFSTAGAAGAAVMAFGFGVAEICDAIKARGDLVDPLEQVKL